MTRLNLRQRLLLLSLLPSAVIAITLVSYFTLQGMRTLEAELRTKAMSSVRYLAQISEYGIISGQAETLYGLAQAIVQDPGVKAAVIVSPKGRVIAVSGRVSLSSDLLRQSLREPALVHETPAWMGFGAPVYRSLNESDPLFDLHPENKEKAENEPIGQVFIELDKEELVQRQRELLMRGLIIVMIGLGLIASLTVAMAENLARPIRRLVDAVERMARGELDTRVDEKSPAEFGKLERGFNEMATHIEEVHHSMQTRIEDATAQLAFQARHDALTGLLNRREFEARLERTLTAVQAGSEECSLLFIDLDRFKPVNDTCGHLAGDELLRQIAQLFQGRLRDEDILGRLGGDEFGVILANCNLARARQVADDLCALTSAYRFIWQDKVFSIGASIGLTLLTRRVRNITELLAAADAACYRAKESGRNQVCEQEVVAQPERRQSGSDWATRIANALSDNRLVIEAQPLLALHQPALPGHAVELTGHLQEPGHAPIALAALMDAAERDGLAPNIDLLFLETALKALERARSGQQRLHCLVPLSAASLNRHQTLEFIAGGLADRDLSGEGLCLMFNEEVIINQSGLFLEFARQVRSLGCQIGLENFGGSLTSFSQLRSLAPSCVKLSHSLTRDIGTNRTSTALLRAIREITADQDIHTIATHVDEPSMLGHFDSLGITYVQGRAVAPQEPFEAWLEGAVMRNF